ncbi:MAG: TIM44-like domain-containing protein [Xanthobacteraceae bacterium]
MLRFRLGPWVAVLALLSGLALGAADYADARIGGGRSSFGSRGFRTFSAPPATRTTPGSVAPIERSVTQPGTFARPNAATPGVGGAFNRPGLFGGGLLGGLAAGFLGAGLFGLLFGHGLFGGLGGFASLLGLLLQIGLVVFVGVLLFRMWQGRRQPALASGPQLRDIGPRPSGLGSFGGGAASAAPVTGMQPIEIEPEDYQAFERLLGEIQAAYSAEDLNALRARVTPEMLSYMSEELAQNASRGVVNRVSNVKLEQGDLAEAWREGDTEYATVAMRFSLVDRTLDRASGRLVEGSDTPEMATEVWTFRRARGGAWLLSAIQQTG